MKFIKQCFVIFPFLAAILLIGCVKSNPSEKLKPKLEKYIEYWNTGEFMGIEETLHPDFEIRMSPGFEPEIGIATFKENLIKWRTAYPDFHIEIKEWVMGTDKVAGIWIISATNTGAGSHPPTGKHIEVRGMSIIHFEEGKIRDEWIASNNLSWLTQLGFELIPPEFGTE